jgi:type 1 glutamine amidotransferase
MPTERRDGYVAGVSDRLLFVTQVAPYADGPAGVHGVLTQAALGVAQVAELHGLDSQQIDDVRGLSVSELERARALALFTIGETPWSAEQRRAILSGVREGRLAVVSIHSATDSCYAWDDYGGLGGARFDGHPWTQTFVADVLDSTHPACSHLGAEWRWHDEVYQFRDLRTDAQVLLRVRDGELDLAVPGARPPSFGYPLAWCFAEGRGRVFSTSLGHFPGAWETPAYLRHVAGGLTWALGAAA